MLLPVPAGEAPHEPVNHSAVAPVPEKPPEMLKVVLLPLQIAFIPEILRGAVDNVLTVMSCEAQAVTLQVPLYLT